MGWMAAVCDIVTFLTLFYGFSFRLFNTKGDFVHKWDELKECTVIYLNNERGWFKAVSAGSIKALLCDVRP